jgi:hypothetical protein
VTSDVRVLVGQGDISAGNHAVGIADRAAQTALEGLRTDRSDVESDEKSCEEQTQRGFHLASGHA